MPASNATRFRRLQKKLEFPSAQGHLGAVSARARLISLFLDCAPKSLTQTPPLNFLKFADRR
jgi:hypothetical protein